MISFCFSSGSFLNNSNVSLSILHTPIWGKLELNLYVITSSTLLSLGTITK